MQESVSMHKCPTPVRHSRMNQARSGEEEKRETGKTEARRLIAKKAAQQSKILSEEQKQGYLGTTRVNKVGREK